MAVVVVEYGMVTLAAEFADLPCEMDGVVL